MISVKKILLPTDFSESSVRTFKHALSLAEKYEAEVILLHVLVLYQEDPHQAMGKFDTLKSFYEESEKRAGKLMEGIISEQMGGHAKLTQKITRGLDAADRILDIAKEEDVDIIFMGTHGHSGFRHFFVGSVTEKVVRFAPCPVMTIRESKEEFRSSGRYLRILFPVDFSVYSQHALKYAFSFAREYNAKVDVVHVVEQTIHPAFYSSGRISVFDIVPDLTERSTKALQDFVNENAQYMVNAEYHVLEGAAHDEIIKFAEQHDNDLIVMGTRGLSGFEHFLLGSTTEKVFRKVDCPVLTIHHPEKEFVSEGNNR